MGMIQFGYEFTKDGEINGAHYFKFQYAEFSGPMRLNSPYFGERGTSHSTFNESATTQRDDQEAVAATANYRQTISVFGKAAFKA